MGGGVTEFQFATLLYETLVRIRPGGTELEPGLATAWHAGPDRSSWTFSLRRAARFHDDTPFDAAAVCANFERWYRFRGILQSPIITNSWQNVFGGFATRDDQAAPDESLYRSCEPRSEHEVVLNLTRASGVVLNALALPAFSIASPNALRQYEADRVSGKPSNPTFDGTFATEHPTGTGPFRLEAWNRQEKVVLVRNDGYWGEKPKLARIVFPTIPESAARRQALESGEIDAYDVVEPGDLPLLERAGFRVVRRPPFNVGVIALNRRRPPLDSLLVRQAVAHAIDRETLVRAKYQPGSQVADQFLPPALWGRAEKVSPYDHDPARARELLAGSGVPSPSLEVWYRTDYTSPILVDPAGLVQALKADLEAVGFAVQVKAVARAEYLEARSEGRLQLWIDETYGGWGDPDSFLRPFAAHREVYGLDSQGIVGLIDQAAKEPEQDNRKGLYGQLNRELVDDLPAVPFVHVPISLAASSAVKGVVAGPLPWDLSFMRTVAK